MTNTIMELSDKPCSSCSVSSPTWIFPTGVFCAECYHNGETPDPKVQALNSKARGQASPLKRAPRQHPEADFQNQTVIPFLKL